MNIPSGGYGDTKYIYFPLILPHAPSLEVHPLSYQKKEPRHYVFSLRK